MNILEPAFEAVHGPAQDGNDFELEILPKKQGFVVKNETDPLTRALTYCKVAFTICMDNDIVILSGTLYFMIISIISIYFLNLTGKKTDYVNYDF